MEDEDVHFCYQPKVASSQESPSEANEAHACTAPELLHSCALRCRPRSNEHAARSCVATGMLREERNSHEFEASPTTPALHDALHGTVGGLSPASTVSLPFLTGRSGCVPGRVRYTRPPMLLQAPYPCCRHPSLALRNAKDLIGLDLEIGLVREAVIGRGGLASVVPPGGAEGTKN